MVVFTEDIRDALKENSINYTVKEMVVYIRLV